MREERCGRSDRGFGVQIDKSDPVDSVLLRDQEETLQDVVANRMMAEVDPRYRELAEIRPQFVAHPAIS